jgi:hypothetical protein
MEKNDSKSLISRDIYGIRVNETDGKSYLFKNGNSMRIATAPELCLASQINKENELSGSESLFGFLGMCMVEDTEINLGKGCNHERISLALANYCDRNGLSPPREGWQEKLI